MHILYDFEIDLDAFLTEMEQRQAARREQRYWLSDSPHLSGDVEPTKH